MSNKISVAVRRKPEQDRSRKRVTAILEAARLLIARQGIEPLSITEVAAEAGMGLTALYRYFPNKTAVIRQLSVEMLEQDKAGLLSDVMELDVSIDELFTYATEQYVKLHEEEPYRLALRTAIQSDATLLEIDMKDTRANARILAQKMADIAKLKNPEPIEAFVLLYMNLLNATIMLMSKTKDDEEADALLQTLLSMALHQLHTVVKQAK